MNPDLVLSALLCSRLCHDLVGPISAISNGIEFLDDENAEMQRRARELLSESSEQMARRLQFFRIAFGRAGGGALTPKAAATTTAGFLREKKIDLDWPDPSGEEATEPERRAVKLVMNMILLAGDSLVRGGSLAVRVEPRADALGVTVRANGPTVELGAAHREALELGKGSQAADALSQIEPRTVQPFLTGRLAQSLGASLTLSAQEPDCVELRAEIPSP